MQTFPDLKPYLQYKDSGLPWLGKVPGQWRVRRIKSLFHETEERSGDGEGLLLSLTRERGLIPQKLATNRIASAEDLSKYKVTKHGYLVMNRMQAWSGMFAISTCDGLVSPDYSVFRSICDLEMKYFVYLFKTPIFVGEFAQLSKGIGTGFNRLYTPEFGSLPCVFPPLDEQKAIVRYLDHMDRLIKRYIHAKQKQIRLLNEQKQAIIHQAVTRGLNPDVPLKPSGIEWLGDIPDHWEVLSIGASSESIQTGPFGSQMHSNDYVIGGIPVINPSHISNGHIYPNNKVTVGEKKAIELERHKLKVNDVVIARRGELGKCAAIIDGQEGWLCGTGSLRIRLREGFFNPPFLIKLISSPGVRNYLHLSSIGATMDNLNSSIVARLRMPKPPLQEQYAIIQWINEASQGIETVISKAQAEIGLLKEYRTRLIANVVTGKLDVREAALRLPEELEAAEAEEEIREEEELDELEVEVGQE